MPPRGWTAATTYYRLPRKRRSMQSAKSWSCRCRPNSESCGGRHGGQEEVGAGVTGLFGWHRLISPRESVENHRIYCETCVCDPTTFPPAPGAWGSWVPELIPFATFNDCDLCVHAASGEVWEFQPGGGLLLHRPSIAAVLREVLAAVRSGAEPQLGEYRGPT